MTPRLLPDLLPAHPVLLAPMDDVTDQPFRTICRAEGADMAYTEFINVDQLLAGSRGAKRKMNIAADQRPVGIQIYGSDAAHLVDAARIARQADPTVIDINCGCWIPRIARRGAGSAWLRCPADMMAMAERVVQAVDCPVTVKTRLGWGDEVDGPPIVALARSLESVGVAAITLHCRTALQRHEGMAEWIWAARAQQAVGIPIILNGGINTPADAVQALLDTGCAGLMVGRAAIGNPWIFGQIRQVLAGQPVTVPTQADRLRMLVWHLQAAMHAHGETYGVLSVRKHLSNYLVDLPDGEQVRRALLRESTVAGCQHALAILAPVLNAHVA